MPKHLRLVHVALTLISLATTGKAPVLAKACARDLLTCETTLARRLEEVSA